MIKTGVAFPDFVQRESPGRVFKNSDKSNSSRDLFLIICLGIVVGMLLLRTVYLQVIKGPYYRYLSDTNRIKTIPIHAARGIIFDRNKVPLVFNVPGFREKIGDKTQLLTREEALGMIAKGKSDLEVDNLRSYPYKEVFAHVLGYIGQISKEEIKSPKFAAYNASDVIGKAGIESQYEDRLKGANGGEMYEVDAHGNLVRKLGQTDPVSGQDITLTLDVSLQKAVFETAKGIKKGAVIVSSPKGEILAMISEPVFDPNLFTLGSSYKAPLGSAYLTLSDVLLDSQNQPLLNRVISGQYPPGSTFKLVVAASGLEKNIIDSSFTVEDTGILRVGDFSFSNWFFTSYGETDGTVDVVKGIQRSNDIFFYKLAEKIGVSRISEIAKNFGVGQVLGIDLAGEASGTLPSPKWKEEIIGEQWYLGDTYHYGIGQGYLLTTPLQVNAWTQAIANKGNLYKPYLNKDQKPKLLSKDLLNENSASLIRQGMIEACSPGGVAWPFFDYKVKNSKLKVDGKDILEVPISSGSADMKQVVVACKTGTAEHGVNKEPHAWITLFAPAYKPEIIITVLSEESGEGSNVAAPIAKKILDYWFTK